MALREMGMSREAQPKGRQKVSTSEVETFVQKVATLCLRRSCIPPTSTQHHPAQMEEIQERHCWECLRRRLVCDFARPGCKRCATSGTACPGYEDVRPLVSRWLAPGVVTSRKRRLPAERTDLGEDDRTTAGASDLADCITIPLFDIKTENCVLTQAAEYCERDPRKRVHMDKLTLADNTCIYQDLIPIHELGPNPSIYPLSYMHIRSGTSLPDYLRLSFVSMTLSHRINRLRDSAPCNVLVRTLWQYRGMVIRSLRESISAERDCMSDVVLAGTISLLLADVSHEHVTSSWSPMLLIFLLP